MKARGGIRSSARLSGEATRNPGSGSNGGPGRPAEQAAAAAAAAQRRARAAERAREVEDSPRVLRDKCRRLARALRNAKHLVVYTGAGISTAADIPDYRGPHGVWTRLQRGETVGRVEVSLAQPTFTHMALTALWARGALKFVVSQNCDGLHLRAGLPRRALAELHGDMFCELCAACRRVILRAFDTTERTARHAHGTRRLCHACGAELRDSIVHFGERGRAAWPLNWAGALRHAARADVVLCLGSSLKVLRRYPRLWRMQAPPAARPALYIVNLQWTPKDAGAALKINARCDAVMRQLARRLRLRVPRYRAAADPLLAHAQPLLPAEAHTTSRPLLAPAPTHHAHEDFSSPSASDSDEELPLRRLAERLRVPPRPSPPPLARRVSPAERSCGMDEEVSSRNEKPFRAFSSIRSDESQQERYSLENKYVSPNERFFSSNKERSSNKRPLSPNEFLVSLNNRNTTPNKRVSLLNDCPLSPKDNVSIYRNTSPNGRPLLVNMRSSSPHDISLMPNDRPLTPNDRPLAANDSPLAPNDRPLTLNDRTLTLNDRSFMPNDRTFTPNERPLTPNDRLMTPNDRLLTPSDRPLAPNDRPLTLNDRPLAPNVRLLTPCTTHYSPLTNSPNNRQFLANGKLPPPRGGRPPPDLLRAFQVKMHSGEATILLRAQHAPAPPPALTALRSFRMVRPRPGLTLNGEANDDEFTPIKKEITIKKEELIIKKEEFSMKTEKFDPRMEAGSEKDECAVDARLTKEEPCGGGGRALGSRLRRLLEGGAGADGAEEGAEALAAAYFARAVLVCRAQLYPGLHTILAPAPAAAAAECPWCLRRYQARRCLWYGPPRAPPAARRPQCACCGPNAPPHAKPEPQDGGGWYGKGYRKGRRKRR